MKTNISQRYGDAVPVTVGDYQTLNPDASFIETSDGIYEYDDCVNLVEQVAVNPVEEMRLVMSRLGSRTSDRKAASSRVNGKKGGRPRKI